MQQPMDRQPPRKALGDVHGRKAERVSEYFDFTTWPDKADKKVTRQELLAILTRKWKIEQESKWHRRLWRWLARRPGSKPHAIGGGTPEDEQRAQEKAEQHRRSGT
jgi:hypothetical protein